MSRHHRHPRETPQILCILRIEQYLWGVPEYPWSVPEYPWSVPEYPWGVPEHPWESLDIPGAPWESIEKIFYNNIIFTLSASYVHIYLICLLIHYLLLKSQYLIHLLYTYYKWLLHDCWLLLTIHYCLIHLMSQHLNLSDSQETQRLTPHRFELSASQLTVLYKHWHESSKPLNYLDVRCTGNFMHYIH